MLGGREIATGFARALTRENSVPGQLTRKGMSSLSWGSARPPPDASKRPQRTNNTGPPWTRLRAPPPPSSILRCRFLQPPPQPPLPTEERRGGGGGGGGGGTTKHPGSRGPNRRHVSFRRAGQRHLRPLGPSATVSGAGGNQHPGPPSRPPTEARTPVGVLAVAGRGEIEHRGFWGADFRRPHLGPGLSAQKWRHRQPVSPGGCNRPFLPPARFLGVGGGLARPGAESRE